MSILISWVAANTTLVVVAGVVWQRNTDKLKALAAALKDMANTSQREKDKWFNDWSIFVKQNVNHRRQHAKLLTSLNQQIVDLQKEMLKDKKENTKQHKNIDHLMSFKSDLKNNVDFVNSFEDRMLTMEDALDLFDMLNEKPEQEEKK